MKSSLLKSLILIVFVSIIPSISAKSQSGQINLPEIAAFPINSHTYLLISYAEMPDIGRVGTNHLLYARNNKAFLFDSPYNNELAGKLYQFVKDSLKAEITMMSVSHWHWDHSGGLDTLNKLGVQTYSYYKTRELMQIAGLNPAKAIFNDSIAINFEGDNILLAFYGAAHTSDNSIGWIESEKILFSGSIIRSMDNTNLGYLKDADVKAWPLTLEKVNTRFKVASWIIPGHCAPGGPELFKHTFELVRQ
jgi:metallo-beta-lactamase class B